jgi:uridine phosphorylase
MNASTAPSATDLIKNSDGSVYHLGLQPDDLADRILLVGDPERVPEISKHWDRLDLVRSRREFVTHTGWMGSQRLTVCSTGIGTDNVDIVMHELDALRRLDWDSGLPKESFRPLNLLRVGTAGCLQSSMDEGQVLVSSVAIAFDGLLSHYRVPFLPHEISLAQSAGHALYGDTMPASGHAVSADPLWLQRTEEAGLPSGINWTCAGFYGPQGRNLHGWSSYPDLLRNAEAFRTTWGGRQQGLSHLEMETAGLYGLSRLMGHRAISISALLAHRWHHRFCPEPQAIMQGCIQKILQLLNEHPQDPD